MTSAIQKTLIAFLIGILLGGVFGYLMGKDVLIKKGDFQPLGQKRTAKSFADQLYGVDRDDEIMEGERKQYVF